MPCCGVADRTLGFDVLKDRTRRGRLPGTEKDDKVDLEDLLIGRRDTETALE